MPKIKHEGSVSGRLSHTHFHIQELKTKQIMDTAYRQARQGGKSQLMAELIKLERSMMSGYNPDVVIIDSLSAIDPDWYCSPIYDTDYIYDQDKDGPKKPYWTQPIPNPQETKAISSPSDATKAKLRAKRKKRK